MLVILSSYCTQDLAVNASISLASTGDGEFIR
jgi:hypothetical protein